MGGYQLPMSMDIFRGRYRQGFDKPKAIPANKAERYRFALPNVDHVFLPGHRIMVQIQSSWFPLYDRNPQTFVPNIFHAKPGDYARRPSGRVSIRSAVAAPDVFILLVGLAARVAALLVRPGLALPGLTLLLLLAGRSALLVVLLLRIAVVVSHRAYSFYTARS
jgi:hypothetical protein